MFSKRIEYLVELSFSNNITEIQKEELAQMVVQLSDEEIQFLLEKAWIHHVPNTTLPDDISDKIIASFTKQDKPSNLILVENLHSGSMQVINSAALAGSGEENETWTKNSFTNAELSPVVQMQDSGESRARRIFPFIMKVAASVAAVVVIFFLGVNQNSGNKKEIPKVFSAAYGERKNFQLPDGSVVALNAGSKMTISANYGISSRDIYLEGEAFFDVKHDKNLPFIVHTAAMDVKALGTAFDVKAYPGEKITETSLVRGLVEVTLKEEQNRKVMLHPNQKVQWRLPASKPDKEHAESAKAGNRMLPIISNVQNLIKTEEGDVKEIAWKNNKLVFTDESFTDIAILLERWYGVKVVFVDDAIRNYRFTGIFEREELGSVLSILKESRNFNYRTTAEGTVKVNLYK